MKPHFTSFLFYSFLLVSISGFSQSVYVIEWENEFNESEKQKITKWLDRVFVAVEDLYGQYPFTATCWIHRRDNSSEPVPWAHTSRGNEQGVHFYIDPSYSLSNFLNDWTAPHEISHLAIPFIGKENMWFSEGFASYSQYKVMEKMGVMSAEEAEEKKEIKLKMIQPHYNSDLSFLEVSNNLKANHNYPALYWGGACFFWQIDKQLRKSNKSGLSSLIMKYQKEGRLKDHSLDELIKNLDELNAEPVFSVLLKKFQIQSAKEAISF